MVTPAWEHLVDLRGPLPIQLFVPGVREEDVQVLPLLGIVVVCMQQENLRQSMLVLGSFSPSP